MAWSTWKGRSSPCYYYVHYAIVMSKKYEVLFHHNTHYAVVSKIQILVPSLKRFLLRSLHRWSWQIYLHFNTKFTTPKSWITNNDFIIFASTFITPVIMKKNRLCECRYYAHYAMIALKNKSIFIVTLHSLSIYLAVAATFTTQWSWHKIKLISIPILFSLHNF